MPDVEQVLCLGCGQGKKIHAKGLCRACYQTGRRKSDQEKPNDFPISPEAADETDELAFTPPDPLTRKQVDEVIIKGHAGGIPYAVGPVIAKKAKSERSALIREYLQSIAPDFRRKIIKHMMNMGYDQKEVIAAFYSDDALREHYIEPMRDPKGMFERDFKAVSKDIKDQKHRSVDIDTNTYIERLEMLFREAMDQAAHALSASTRSQGLAMAEKLTQQIAAMQGVVKVTVGQGYVPASAQPSSPDGADQTSIGDRDLVMPGEEDEEEDVYDDKY